ncbi:MAG TPA: hypothetical protein VGE27_16135 [Gemmatimonas sp.]|uniref:hypothetical protein n=1 Tax=Gemmatimonas sp. TaxID=1962908 RepID=UPI002ED86272
MIGSTMSRLAVAAMMIAAPQALVAQGVVDTKPATPARVVSAEAAGTVSTVGAAAAARKGAAPAPATEITLHREVFSYSGGGRRDPYKSLMSSSDVRPLLSDLRLTAVAFDPDGQNSVAILRDSYSKLQYRIRVGQQLGRLRVSAIRQKAVQFTIEEFGFNRQETLSLSSDTTKVRNP